MGIGAWWVIVHRVAELDTTVKTQHICICIYTYIDFSFFFYSSSFSCMLIQCECLINI